MVLGCRCGVELVVCVSVVRVWLCFGVVVWFFGAVFGWAFGCKRACGVCSRLLEMADFRFPLLAGGTLRRGLSGILVFVNFGCAIGIRRSSVGYSCSRVARLFQESRQGALIAVGQDTLPDSCRSGKTGALSSTASARGWGLQSVALRP